VASLLSRLDAAREHHMDSLDSIETFMKSYKIPQDTKSKVRSYYHYLWTQHRGYRDTTLVEGLPVKLQSELYFSINKPIIEKVSFLKGAEQELLEDIMQALEPRIFVPGERVFRIDEHGDALYLIHSGQVEILTRDNQIIATLTDGAVFGEIALISDKPRTATVRAKTYCDLYVLPKEAFNRVISAYPEFKKQLEIVMNERQQPAPAKAS
jgi:voltage-gated potassium channel